MKYQIGQIIYDTATESLVCNNEVLRPRMKVLLLLKSLIEHPGQLVTRDELIERIWDGNYLTGSKALNSVVYTLRNLLNGPEANVNAIETIPKCGYRLVVEVSIIAENDCKPSRRGVLLGKMLTLLKSLHSIFLHRIQKQVLDETV